MCVCVCRHKRFFFVIVEQPSADVLDVFCVIIFRKGDVSCPKVDDKEDSLAFNGSLYFYHHFIVKSRCSLFLNSILSKSVRECNVAELFCIEFYN